MIHGFMLSFQCLFLGVCYKISHRDGLSSFPTLTMKNKTQFVDLEMKKRERDRTQKYDNNDHHNW